MDDYMTRDLPNEIDLEDLGRVVDIDFDHLRLTDDTNDFPRILRLYADADANARTVMNDLFISLCGYSLPTLAERAFSKSWAK